MTYAKMKRMMRRRMKRMMRKRRRTTMKMMSQRRTKKMMSQRRMKKMTRMKTQKMKRMRTRTKKRKTTNATFACFYPSFSSSSFSNFSIVEVGKMIVLLHQEVIQVLFLIASFHQNLMFSQKMMPIRSIGLSTRFPIGDAADTYLAARSYLVSSFHIPSSVSYSLYTHSFPFSLFEYTIYYHHPYLFVATLPKI